MLVNVLHRLWMDEFILYHPKFIQVIPCKCGTSIRDDRPDAGIKVKACVLRTLCSKRLLDSGAGCFIAYNLNMGIKQHF